MHKTKRQVRTSEMERFEPKSRDNEHVMESSKTPTPDHVESSSRQVSSRGVELELEPSYLEVVGCTLEPGDCHLERHDGSVKYSGLNCSRSSLSRTSHELRGQTRPSKVKLRNLALRGPVVHQDWFRVILRERRVDQQRQGAFSND